MKKALIVYLMLCLLAPTTMEAKKKKFGNNLYWELSTDGTLTISGIGRMPDFKEHKTPWYQKRDVVKYIVVEEGVTYIGEYAFAFGKWDKQKEEWLGITIEEAVLPRSLEEVGANAFGLHKHLIKKVTVSDINSFLAINNNANNPKRYAIVRLICRRLFVGNCEVTHLKIPIGTTIFKGILCEGTNITSVEIPNTVKTIDVGAFYGLDKLRYVDIPTSVTRIEERAFYGCSNLASIFIPYSVTSIGINAFYGFSGEIITLPPLVTESNNPEQWGFSRAAVEAYKNSVRDSDGKVILAAKDGRTATKQTCGSTTYYLVAEDGKKGIMGTDGQWIVPMTQDYSAMELISNGRFVKVRKGNFYGIMTLTGEVIIPVSRNYTSIGDFDNSSRTFAYTKQGFSGTCNEQGQEISEEKLPLTADNIKARGGYASVVEIMDGTTKYFKVSKGGRYGITDAEGNEIIPTELEALESAGTGYLRYKLNGFWGLMNYAGKILIDTDRGYTSIGDYKSFNKRFAYTMNGYKGECDATGRQISKIKVETPKPSTAVASSSGASSSSRTSSSSSSSGSSASGSQTQTVVVEHHRDPVPVQEWHACIGCGGMGTMGCDFCGGSGTKYIGDRLHRCSRCNGRGIIPCNVCYGNKGQYITVYK